jgi:hypothetical protein
MNVPKNGLTAARDCTKRRLAEGEVVIVDGCDCGAMQLHMGALTLRLSTSAVTSLVETLQRALNQVADRGSFADAPLAHVPRGRA